MMVRRAPPIVIMPRDGTITVFSDDVDALEQLEKLLRALSQPTEIGGRGFAVFALKYAGATALAETIQKSLRLQGSGGGGGGRWKPHIRPDRGRRRATECDRGPCESR